MFFGADHVSPNYGKITGELIQWPMTTALPRNVGRGDLGALAGGRGKLAEEQWLAPYG